MAWTLTITKVARARHYLKVKVACLSDGNAMAATDLLAQTGASINDLEGSTLMAIKADPGSGATQPDNAWDFTISDDESDALYTSTGNSETAISWHDMSSDIGMYPPILNKLYLTFPTAADWTANDTVDLYLICWVEDK